MPEFIADTSGRMPDGTTWGDLRPMVRGYLECVLFTNTCTGISMVEWDEPENVEAVAQGQADGSIPDDSGFGDFWPESIADAIKDCEAFETKAADLLAQAYALGYEEEQAGRDFWYDRNGHGVGFSDRKELEAGLHESYGSPRVDEPNWSAYAGEREHSIGVKLSAIARDFREVYVSFGEAADGTPSPTGYGFVFLE